MFEVPKLPPTTIHDLMRPQNRSGRILSAGKHALEFNATQQANFFD